MTQIESIFLKFWYNLKACIILSWQEVLVIYRKWEFSIVCNNFLTKYNQPQKPRRILTNIYSYYISEKIIRAKVVI